ncbi:unnamed protein product, partial [Iphiclides podalirius]
MTETLFRLRLNKALANAWAPTPFRALTSFCFLVAHFRKVVESDTRAVDWHDLRIRVIDETTTDTASVRMGSGGCVKRRKWALHKRAPLTRFYATARRGLLFLYCGRFVASTFA